MTPAEKIGLAVRDEVEVIGNTYPHCYEIGDVVKLSFDGGSDLLYFERNDGKTQSLYINDIRPLGKPPKKLTDATELARQEALTKIDTLEKELGEVKAFIENLDKPKRVRVYIKEDVEGLSHMAGKVFDFMDLTGGGNICVWKDHEHSNYTVISAHRCIIVEGHLPKS